MTQNIQSFTATLNHWGKQKTPFVFLVDYASKMPQAWQVNDINANEILYNFNGFSNQTNAIAPIDQFHFIKHPISFEKYKEKFDHVVQNIKSGNSFLVNLSVQTPVETNLTLQDIFHQSEAPYRFWLKDRFVCFSPEIFIKIKNQNISAFPMKGTIDASIPNAESIIIADAKEAAEHATIVDLIRNDISMVAEKVWVERYRYIDHLRTSEKNLLQVSSEISGILPEDFDGNFGDILLKLLPAGSICGAPKPKTLEIIEEAEGYDRGYYTGVMGFFDGNNFESAVMIRYIEQSEDKLVFKSGGGITAQSKALDEYQELIDKAYLPFPHVTATMH